MQQSKTNVYEHIMCLLIGLCFMLIPWHARAEDQTKANFELTGFQSVVLRSFIDVEITTGKPYAVQAIGAAELINRLKLKIEDGTLIIDVASGLFSANSGSLLVQVFMPDAQMVSLIGSGDMRVNGFRGQRIFLKGSGDLTINNIFTRVLTISLSGSGDLSAEGRCGLLTTTLGGSGDVRAQRLRCEGVDAQLAGSGALHVHAVQAIRASLRGSGNIWVYGKPFKFEANIIGSGTVLTAQ
jgi:hypothetical protein